MVRGRFYAFVESISQPSDGESGYARLDLTLDCVIAHSFHESIEGADERLQIVRVLTTNRRLRERFQLQRVPSEGDWLLIELALDPGNPIAWALSAVNDYQGDPNRTNLVGLWPVDPEGVTPDALRPSDPDGIRLLSLVTGNSLTEHYRPSKAANRGADKLAFEALFAQVASTTTPKVRVLDVGQASCAAIYSASDPKADVLGFFDVGAPIWFHGNTMPRACDIKLPTKGGFVVLSHWDFDHYAMAWWRKPALRNLNWYAPLQRVGANGARFQAKLGARLHYIEETQIGIDRFWLFKGTGARRGLADDRNATGYVMRVEDQDGARLLTGDLGYDFIPAEAIGELMGLTIPHHAGSATGIPPAPHQAGARAIASYGLPNRYRHPDQASLRSHCDRGWTVEPTAAHGGRPRQSHWL